MSDSFFFYKATMDSSLRLSEGADVLDVYDNDDDEHKEEEGRDIAVEFHDDDEPEEEYDDDEYDDEATGGYGEEEELEDDLTSATHPGQEKEKEEECAPTDADDKQDASLSQPFEEENEKKEETQQVDPSLLALAEDHDDILDITTPPVREEPDPTVNREIKKTVYDLMMTNTSHTSATPLKKKPSPPTSYRLPPSPDHSFYLPSAENVRPSPISPNVSFSVNNSKGSANDYYSLLMEGNDEIEGREDQISKEIQSQIVSGGKESVNKYPTEFSAHLIHNYDAVYKQSSSSRSPPQQPTPSPIPRSVPQTLFPIEREVSEESIMEAANEKAFSSHESPSPPPLLPQSENPPGKSPNMANVFSKANILLGGREAMRKINENMEAVALKVKVQMLRETTKNLRCSDMVDIIFGDGAVPKKPSLNDLRNLKNIIAVELTLNEFIKSSKVTDVRSAELFRMSSENLEMVQRQQIMSNPLFSEIISASSLFSSLRQRQTINKETAAEEEKEEIGGGREGEVVASNNSANNLHMEFFNLLHFTPGEKDDPCHRLSDRVSFLNRLIHHKTASIISWTRLVNLVSNISSQAAVVLLGNGDEQNIHSREDTGYASPKLMVGNDSNAVKNMNMGSIGVDLFFGAVSDMLEKNINTVCENIGKLAIYLNIPVVQLQWPQEFIRTDEYKKVLMLSISSFSAKGVIPSMYIIEQIMFDDEEKEQNSGGEEEHHNLELFSGRDKKASINKLYNEIRSGRGRERELMRCIFHEQQHHHHQTTSNNLLDMSTAYSAVASIIDDKIPVFDNIMNSVTKYLDKRKHLISAAVIKLLKKAKLNITVYCIKNKLNNVSAKCDKKIGNEGEDDAPMQNLMYRSSALPVTGKRRGSIEARRRGDTPDSIKRPPRSLITSRMKRLKTQWGTTYADESESTDGDTDSGIRDE